MHLTEPRGFFSVLNGDYATESIVSFVRWSWSLFVYLAKHIQWISRLLYNWINLRTEHCDNGTRNEEHPSFVQYRELLLNNVLQASINSGHI